MTEGNHAEIQSILSEADSLWPAHYQKLQEELRCQRILKVGRNDPCPCGSGKKPKECCLQ